MSGKSLTKVAMARLFPGLFTVPEHLTKPLRGAEEIQRRHELEEFLAGQETRIMETAKWLQHDGFIVYDTLNNDQFNRLVRGTKEREQYVKVSPALGGLWSKFCTVKQNHAEAQLAAAVEARADGRKRTNPANIIEDHREAVKAWEAKRDEKLRLEGLSKRKREAEMVRRGWCTNGKPDYAKLEKWVGDYPELPPIVLKKHHKVRTVKITLIQSNTKQVVKTKQVPDGKGGTKKKKVYVLKQSPVVVKELIAPLDDDVRSGEIGGVVASVVARIPKDGTVPDWDEYNYTVVK